MWIILHMVHNSIIAHIFNRLSFFNQKRLRFMFGTIGKLRFFGFGHCSSFFQIFWYWRKCCVSFCGHWFSGGYYSDQSLQSGSPYSHSLARQSQPSPKILWEQHWNCRRLFAFVFFYLFTGVSDQVILLQVLLFFCFSFGSHVSVREFIWFLSLEKKTMCCLITCWVPGRWRRWRRENFLSPTFGFRQSILHRSWQPWRWYGYSPEPCCTSPPLFPHSIFYHN